MDSFESFVTNSASLDRIDNDKGYLQGNVRFVAVIANFARNRFPDQAVFDFCNAVAKTHPIYKERLGTI